MSQPSEPRQAAIVLGLLAPLLIATGVLFPSAAGPVVLLAVLLAVLFIRDTPRIRRDGTLDPDSSNFISRTLDDYLVRQHERHRGPGTAPISRRAANPRASVPRGLRIVIFTTCLTTTYLAMHLAVAGSIDANVHRLLLPVLVPANAVNTHGVMEGLTWGLVLGGPIAIALGLTLTRAARAGGSRGLGRPIDWAELRLPVLLILLGAGYAALAAAAIGRELTRSAAEPAGDTVLFILLAHTAAAATILPGMLVLSMLTIARRIRAGSP